MPLCILIIYQLWILICIIFEALADWELSCYNESLNIHCGSERTIIIHEAHFGYFREILLISNLTNRCRPHNSRDCWVDVTANISRRCSGHSICTNSIHYSSDLSAELLAKECPFVVDNLAEPTLFVEYDCISTTLVTRLSNENHVDPEQIGGYLISLNYNEIMQSGSEWRSYLAEAMCNPKSNHLPHQFYLPAPKISPTRYSMYEDNSNSHHETNHGLMNKGSSATFILRIKDIGLTKTNLNRNGISSGSSSSYASSMKGISGSDDLILATGSACPSDPGIACSHDYLSIDARVSSVYDTKINNVPIIRFCLVNSSTVKAATVRSTTLTNTSSPPSIITPETFLLSSMNTMDYNQLYPPDESHLVGQVYGPFSNVYGLQFTSNLNLLDPYIIHGKGIVLEYIALLCVPISPPSGNGVVDYRFRTSEQTSHTFAYAEVFCPSDRWLEPMDPGLDEVYTKSSSTTGDRSLDNNNNPWWLQRRRHVTLICDHHERKWIPNHLPEACLTSDELATFVAQITKNLQERERNTKLLLNNHSQSDSNSINESVMLKNIDPLQLNTTHTSLYLKAANDDDQVTHISSVVLGIILGLLIFLLAVLLVVYSLRHKLFEHYHKTIDLAAISSSSRLGSSSLATFSRSKDTLLFPTSKKAIMSYNGNHTDLFKSYPHLTSHNTINESFPDFPTTEGVQHQQRPFLLHASTLSGVNKKPSNVEFITDGYLPPWRNSLKTNHQTPNAISALTLVPNTPGSDRRHIMNSLPWLRTNSTSHISSTNNATNNHSNMIPNSNDIDNNNNSHSGFGASSETVLFSSLNPPNGIPRSWWLPWRRSMRKKRRLYTQLQRRQEIQSLSQRGLLESGSSFLGKSTPQLPNNRCYMMTSNNTSNNIDGINDLPRLGGTMSTLLQPSLPKIPTSPSSSSISNKEESQHPHHYQHPYSNHIQMRSKRSNERERMTSQCTKTLVTTTPITSNGSNSVKVNGLYANHDPANSPTQFICTNYPMNNPNDNNRLNTSCIYPKTNSNIQSVSSWINVNDNDLPWKFTPPSRSSFSNGMRRLSSFFRGFNHSNGSFTPPRNHYSSSYKKPSYRSSSFNTARSELMPSMPILPSFNYLTTSNKNITNNNDNGNVNGNGRIVPSSNPYPTDSFRLNGRHITHPLIQPTMQSMSESSDLHRKHKYNDNLWSTQTVKPLSLFHHDVYLQQQQQQQHNMYSSGDDHTTLGGDMLSRNTTKTSLQGSSRIDSLLSTELIDLCGSGTNVNNTGTNAIGIKDDQIDKKLNSASVTMNQTVVPNSFYNFSMMNKLDYIEKDELTTNNYNHHFPYITDPYLEPVSLKRRQQRNYNNRDLDTGENKIDDLIKLNRHEQQHPTVHSGTSSAISSLVFADDSDLSKASEHSSGSKESDQYSSLQVMTTQIVSNENHVNNCITNNTTAITVTTNITTTTTKTATTDTIHSYILPPMKHPSTTIDYVTYDETRSYEKKIPSIPNQLIVQSIQPCSVDNNSNLLNKNSTHLTEGATSSTLLSDHEVQRRINTIKSDCDSRPLSEEMISNHYYDLNRNTNYQEISTESYQGDNRNTNQQSLCKSHPPLPPLWCHNSNNSNNVQHFDKNNNNMINRNFGSVDSLYETVDIPRTNSTTPMTMQQFIPSKHFIYPRNIVSNNNRESRRSMALPPTPILPPTSSISTVKAPIRLIGEMDDWNLPSCSDDSE